MKVLSLIQPWASLCVHIDDNGKALKQIETRSWNTKHRGLILIHASKKKMSNSLLGTPMMEAYAELYEKGLVENTICLPLGAIIGCVDLVDTISTNGINYNSHGGDGNGNEWCMSHQELAFGDYSPNRYGWLLSNPILFREPIPCKGQLSIWNLPIELEPLVKHQIELAVGSQHADIQVIHQSSLYL